MTADDRAGDRESGWRRFFVAAVIVVVSVAEVYAHWPMGQGHSPPDEPRPQPGSLKDFPRAPGQKF
jgi:hypothetical protein